MDMFTISAEIAHHVGDHACPMCLEDYPEPCPCGGLMHAEAGEGQDADGNYAVMTRCDRCSRSEDQLDEM